MATKSEPSATTKAGKQTIKAKRFSAKKFVNDLHGALKEWEKQQKLNREKKDATDRGT